MDTKHKKNEAGREGVDKQLVRLIMEFASLTSMPAQIAYTYEIADHIGDERQKEMNLLQQLDHPLSDIDDPATAVDCTLTLGFSNYMQGANDDQGLPAQTMLQTHPSHQHVVEENYGYYANQWPPAVGVPYWTGSSTAPTNSLSTSPAVVFNHGYGHPAYFPMNFPDRNWLSVYRPNNAEGSLLVKRCVCCNRTTTPLWRNGPFGTKSLCNACGIRHKKELRKARENESKNGISSLVWYPTKC